jgi:ATP-dependent Clp protease adaptor protein ClpS
MNMGPDRHPESIEEVEDEIQEDLEEPPLYRVLLHNDDYTTMQFVVEVLMVVFNKSIEEATRIMLNVHKKGVGLCGVYPYEIAETKVDTVDSLARENGFPLKCSMERES